MEGDCLSPIKRIYSLEICVERPRKIGENSSRKKRSGFFQTQAMRAEGPRIPSALGQQKTKFLL